MEGDENFLSDILDLVHVTENATGDGNNPCILGHKEALEDVRFINQRQVLLTA